MIVATENTTCDACAKPIVLSLTHPQYNSNWFCNKSKSILIYLSLRNSDILKCTVTLFGSDITAAVNSMIDF